MSTPTPKTKPIDLSKCKVGQRVKLRNGQEFTFGGLSGGKEYPYQLNEINNLYTKRGTYYHQGESLQDIVAILPPAKKAKKPAKKANTLERFTEAFAKIAFKGDNDLIRKAADELEGLLKP